MGGDVEAKREPGEGRKERKSKGAPLADWRCSEVICQAAELALCG
jgi:hypothetical protein